MVLLGTCSCAVVRCVLCALSGFAAPGGHCCLAPVRVPWLWPAACLSGVRCGPACCAAPRQVRSLSVLQSGFPTPWCLSPPRGLAPPALLGGCAGHAEAGREPGSLCLPLAPAEAGALGLLCVAPVWGPVMRLSLAGPSGVSLGLRALRWLACLDPVTDAFSFPYRLSFDGGLGRCTGAVSCGRRHLPLRVGGRHARDPCVCVCAFSLWPGWAGRPPGRVPVRLTFSFGRFVFLLCLAPSGLGLPRSWSFAFFFLFPRCFYFLSFFFFPCAPFVSCFLWFPAPGALGLGALCYLFGWPRASWLSARSRFLCVAWLLDALRWLSPPPFSLAAVAVPRCLALFFLFRFFFLFSAPPLSLAFCVFRPRVPWALALVCVCCAGLSVPCVFFSSPLSRFFVRSRLFCVSGLAGGFSPVVAAPPPPPLLCLAVFVVSARCLGFFFPLFSCAPVVSGFLRFPALGALGLGAVFCLFFSASRCLALRALSPRLCLPLGRWLLSGGCCPPPPLPFCVSRFWSLLLGALVFFYFFFFPCAPHLSPAFSGFRPRVPWASALCVVCFVGLPLLGSPCAFPSFVLSAWLLAAPWWLLPPPSPLCLAVFIAAARCCVPCAVLCCVSLGAVLRRATARCVARCCAVVCCVALLRSFGAAACCAVPSGAARRPRALCSAALCFAVFPRTVCPVLCVFVVAWWCVLLFAALLCAVCVPGCCAAPSLSSPLCAVLCFCVLVRSRCAVRVVRAIAGVWCCGALLCVVLFPLVCRGAVLGRVARGCLLVACFGVGVPVWPRGLLPCSWCRLLWCPAFLCRVLWCCAVAWCCAVVLCCRVAVLLGLALPSCGLSCCAVLCCWLAVLFFARWWCLRAVVLFPSCCAFPVFCALCAAVPCCAGCGALLPCVVCSGAVVSCGAVLSCSAVVLRCCLCLLCPPAACRAAPCCAVFCRWLSVLFFAWWWRLCAVVPFPSLPARTKKHQSSYMSPRVGGGVVAGMPWWLWCPALDAAHVPPAAKGRRKRRGWGTGGRGRYMVNKRGREGRVQGRGVLRKMFFFEFYALLAT